MITKFNIFESLEERTSNAFFKWYNNLKPIKNEEEEYLYETQLKSWLLFKSYFENKDIFNFKSYEDYQESLSLAKEKYFSKLKNVKEDIDYKIIYKDDNVAVIVPLTLNGSCKYGYNTKWCTSMIERPDNFKLYKNNGELYRFIFNDDIKFSLHWADNGNKFFRDQLDKELKYDKNETFILDNTPFELSEDAKIAVSVDYITKKWNYYYPKKWRKTKKINTIEEYKKYLTWYL